SAIEVAALFSAGREDSRALVEKLLEENKNLAHRVRELDEIACRVEAEELLRSTSPTVREGSPRIVAQVFDNRSADSLKHLALALIAQPTVIALLASRDGDAARLVFARSADASGDMNALMRKACEVIDGHGGGKPDLAQGGGRNLQKIQEAIDYAANQLAAGAGT